MTKKTDLEKLHERGERLLMAVYRSRLIPISKLTEIAKIIDDAYRAGMVEHLRQTIMGEVAGQFQKLGMSAEEAEQAARVLESKLEDNDG